MDEPICDGVCPENHIQTYHRLNQSRCAIAPINMYEEYGNYYCRWCYNGNPHVPHDNLREITLGDHFHVESIKCERCGAELFTPKSSTNCNECITHSAAVIDYKIGLKEIFGPRGRAHTPAPVRPLSDRK